MKKRKQGRKYKKMGIFAIIVGMSLLSLYLFLKKSLLEDRLALALEQKKYETHLYEAEIRRGEELDRMKMNIKSKQFIEEVARDKFGLVYENEILFMPENE